MSFQQIEAAADAPRIDLVAHIVAAQLPVVAGLAIGGVLASRLTGRDLATFTAWTLKEPFRFVATGWIVNFLYLLWKNYHAIPIGAIPESVAGVVERGLSVLGSLLFWSAGLELKPNARSRIAQISLLAVVLGGLFYEVSFALRGSEISESALIFISLVTVLFEMTALYVLYRVYDWLLKELKAPDAAQWLVRVGSLLYVCIQLMALFRGLGVALDSPDLSSSFELAGYSLGLVSKLLLGAGIFTSIVWANVRLDQERVRLSETRRILTRLNHEVAQPLTEMEVHLEVSTRGRQERAVVTEALTDLGNALHRVIAIVDAAEDELLDVPEVQSIEIKRPQTQIARGERQAEVSNVNSLLERAISSMKVSHPNHEVEWDFRYSARCCIQCVRSEIIRVLVNILRNAYDAKVKGQPVRIHVQTLNKKAHGSATNPSSETVELRITDDGEGIPPENLPKIFNLNFSTRGSGPARGIGMGVIKELTEKNAGTVTVESPPADAPAGSRGTRIILRFPRVACRGGKRS